jgi:hypothetical protein
MFLQSKQHGGTAGSFKYKKVYFRSRSAADDVVAPTDCCHTHVLLSHLRVCCSRRLDPFHSASI